jgi:hypothetical protein
MARVVRIDVPSGTRDVQAPQMLEAEIPGIGLQQVESVFGALATA